jgi:transcriptional regulator with XRE-family HTH domain
VWLWTTDHARAALATGDLAAIIRAYRAATGTSQRQLAETLGYDPTYISMIETGRREITDVGSRLRIAQQLGIPPHVIGVTDPDDADFAAMLQFADSTIRLAVLARQSGHGTEAVNELWPLVARLEARVADGHMERDVLLLLSGARAELGVSLGYILPDERLVSAARWTSRALWLAERLDDRDLLALALRVHGNELRKARRPAAAVARLRHALHLVAAADRGPVLVQLARAVGDIGDPEMFEEVMVAAAQAVDDRPLGSLVNSVALHEVRLRGLLAVGRTREAIDMLGDQPAPAPLLPPQWQAILNVTIGEVLLAQADVAAAQVAFHTAISIAHDYRLPHQIQRVIRRAGPRIEETSQFARAALAQLVA